MFSFHKRQIGSADTSHEHGVTEEKPHMFTRALHLFPRSREEFRTRRISIVFAITIVLIAVFFIYHVISAALFYINTFSVSDILFIFAGDISRDEMQRTNVLLVGMGGESHESPDLADTIIVASYNHATKIASMLSIPRDLYLRVPENGSSRINKIYEDMKPRVGSAKALEILRDAAEQVANVEIHYYIRVDFQGFKDVVDILGGVDINVPSALHDEFYPDGKNGFETFHVDTGLQHMDGETALKYARSRRTTSDFDRAQRQQHLLVSIKDKAMSKNIFVSPLKIQHLWDAFKEHVETDMSFAEMISFGRIAKKFDTTKIVSKVLRDIEIVQEGGFLYTPEREFYGGAFVLRPWGETYENIHKYASLIFDTPEIYLENAAIEIQNASGVPGVAQKLMDYLLTFGFRVVRIGNTPDGERYEKTHFAATNPDSFPWTVQKLTEFLPKGKHISSPTTRSLSSNADVVIVIGQDFPMEY